MLEWLSTKANFILRLGLIGALVGASVSFGLREYFDWRRRVRERRGLLTLLDLETDQNERQLISFKGDPAWITRAPANSFNSKFWEESRARLSQLLKKEEFADLLKYYEAIRVIDGARKDAKMQSTIIKGLPQLLEQSDKAIAVIRRYVPKDALKGTPLKNIAFDRDPHRWGKRNS